MESDGTDVPLLPKSQPPHSKKAKDAVYRKIAWRLLSVTFAKGVLCAINRSSVSYAEAGITADVGLSKSEFGTALSLYFVTFMITQIPSNAVMERVRGPTWLGVLAVGCGLASSASGLITSVGQLYAVRLLLGLFQGGVIPGLLYYLTQFFPNSRMSLAMGIVTSGVSAGLGIVGPLCAGILSLDGVLKFSSWRLMLFVQGLPTILLGVWFFFLPVTPGDMLTDAQMEILREDGSSHPTGETMATPMHKNIPYIVKTVLLNVNIWVVMLAEATLGLLRFTAVLWTPVWITAMISGNGLDWSKASTSTSSGVLSAVLSCIPYGLSAVAAPFFAFTAHKLEDRTYHMAALRCLGGLMFVLLPWLENASMVLGFVALTVGHMGINGSMGIAASLSLSFLTAENKSFGVAWWCAGANLGGVLGPMIAGFLADMSGSYKTTMWCLGVMGMVAGCAVLPLKDSVREEAQKRRQNAVVQD